jgi:hypothetical protein
MSASLFGFDPAGVAFMRVLIFEKAGVPIGRTVESSVIDVCGHALAVALALFKLEDRPAIRPISALTARYEAAPPGFQAPVAATAAYLRAVFELPGRSVPVEVQQAKGSGSPRDVKWLGLYDRHGMPGAYYSLAGASHGRVLDALLSDRPVLHHDAHDARDVLGATLAFEAMARRQPDYRWGSLPRFLSDGYRPRVLIAPRRKEGRISGS